MYHQPVMLKETVEALVLKTDGIYVDITFGGGGHSRKILDMLSSKGKLFAFDQDADALQNLPDDERFTFIAANFRYLKRFLRLHGIHKVDGILGDFGVSSYQIDTPERGFSTRFDAPLDMRMDTSKGISAKDVLNTYDFDKLVSMFRLYGEIHQAKALARKIEQFRQDKPLQTTGELVELARPLAGPKDAKFLSQVFQAIRIEVNEELEVIKELLIQSGEVLTPGGRLVLMSYHSLEDRLVKNYFKAANFSGEPEKDLYGNYALIFKQIHKKAIEATQEEIAINPRARSAKLRIGEKL